MPFYLTKLASVTLCEGATWDSLCQMSSLSTGTSATLWHHYAMIAHRVACDGWLIISGWAARRSRLTSMANEMSGFTFPMSFKTQEISTNSVTIHTRVGGAGRAVMLLHGYGEPGDMWVPLAVDLARDHTVIVPDSGPWVMEENPQATIQIVRGFLDASQ